MKARSDASRRSPCKAAADKKIRGDKNTKDREARLEMQKVRTAAKKERKRLDQEVTLTPTCSYS